ncbi:FadR/GntR family transcriptional regulator [Oceanomicrobium pacificus]|uniref:FCD domain-containing protein n=1 Tax=Oceanomicrobium pacificus TaxID=2692916 RepID=A0A6B0TVA5_9RHOB|nr:FCD domain-containing protein [Oceanomicrobium pacificus]MXU65152.1 FCD domain-containing protein [Oceanomicrobium pacificus]
MRAPENETGLDTPIKRESVAEMVARRILHQITTGALQPGDLLPPERELAASLNVSRPSVREAIRGLSILGVVRTRQGGGANISELDAEALLGPIQFFLSLQADNVRALYDARSLIESDVARRAAENMDDAALDALGDILDHQADTMGDPTAFRASDLAFHEALWKGCGNAYLQRIGESLNVIGLEVRLRASETPGVLAQSLKDHRVLLDALRARDPDAAARAAEQHMLNVYKSTVGEDRE